MDVPKLPVPEVSDFVSVMGNKYVREREFDEIAAVLLEPPQDDDEPEEPKQEEPPAQAAPVQ